MRHLPQAHAALVKDGTSDYVIVIPNDAIPSEQTAAQELSDYLQQVSGAKLPIVDAKDYTGTSRMLAIGFNDKLPQALKSVTFGKLADDEIIIAASGNTLLLGGGRPRGSLYAVYEYLHRLGVRWYTPEVTNVPKQRTIELPTKPYRFNPPMHSRSLLIGNGGTDEWNARNRQNQIQLWTSPAEKYGGGYGQGPDMHTFWRLLSVPTLQAHPEWMAQINGARELPVGSAWGACLSNEELRKYLIAQTLDWARKHPDRKGVWIGQNDGSQPCECEKCAAFAKEHGDKPSALTVQLLNELADALKQEMPDRIAKTLAYSWSLFPPTGMTVRDNTMIMFCAPGSAFPKPIATDPAVASIREAITGWRKIASNLEVYLYSAPWENYWFVEPCTYSAAENIKWASKNGVSNLFNQVSGFGDTYGSEAVLLRGWVYARLAWDPTQDPQKLIEDFVNGYYGPAAPAVLKAIKLVHTNVLDKQGNLRLYNDNPTVPKHINPRTIRAINELYDKTYASLKDPVYQKRLSMDWIAYLWTDLWLGFTGPGRYDTASKTWAVPMADGDLRSRYGKLAKQFMIDNKINVLKERRPLQPVRLSLDKMGAAWPATQLQDGNVTAVVIPQVGGKISEFRDSRTDFDPLKPYWGLLITEYPLHGSWRETVNNEYVPSYVVNPPTDNTPGISLEGNAGGSRVRKHVSMKDEALHVDIRATPTLAGKVELSSAFMLDLQDKGFGDYPTIYTEKQNGEWTKRVLGSETTFWYIAGAIDFKDATGRIIIAAEKRPEGLLLTFDPTQITNINFEYDRYKNWSADQGHMVWVSPTRTAADAPAGQPLTLSLQLKILPNAAAMLQELSPHKTP
jgi:hypothetical protein